MVDDELNFDFENSLDPPQNNHQQVRFDLTLCALEHCGEHQPRSSFICPHVPQNGAHVAPDLPPGAPIGQSVGNYKKNYRQV